MGKYGLFMCGRSKVPLRITSGNCLPLVGGSASFRLGYCVPAPHFSTFFAPENASHFLHKGRKKRQLPRTLCVIFNIKKEHLTKTIFGDNVQA